MKVLFAVNEDDISTQVVKKYQQIKPKSVIRPQCSKICIILMQ